MDPVGELSCHSGCAQLSFISPIRKIIRKRKDNVEGLIGEIEAFTAEKQQLLDEYESELRKAREAAAIYRKDGKVMGELERARIFDAASKDAQSA